MIDYWNAFTNLIWIAGAAIVLGTASAIDWQVSTAREPFAVMRHMGQSVGFYLGISLICLGAGLGAYSWGERILWLLLMAFFASLAGWIGVDRWKKAKP